MMVCPSRSASTLTLSALEGSVNESPSPKIAGYDQCSVWLTIGRKTSASIRKVVVSDQLRTDKVMICPLDEARSESILVNGQGPAMQEARALRNALPTPASRLAEVSVAFHLPSGEQGRWSLHGMFPLFGASNVLTALPTLSSVIDLTVYLTRTLDTLMVG